MDQMKPLEEIYSGRFFRTRHRDSWRAKPVCMAIVSAFTPCQTLIDVGCGIGDYVKEFMDMGVDAWGLEGSKECESYLAVSGERIYFGDLRKPLLLDRKFDVAICFEVAEHIEPEYADQFVQNLVTLSDRIVVSAATPSQEGHYHVNCQPPWYWVAKFGRHGYKFRDDLIFAIRSQWADVRDKKPMRSYYWNLLCFTRKGGAR